MTALRLTDSRDDQSASIGTRFDPTERRGDGGGGFGEVGRTADFEGDVVKLSSISPVVITTGTLRY